MISKLYLWLGAILAAIAAFAGVRYQAKSQGKQEAKAEQKEEVMKNVIEAKKITDSNANLADSIKRDKLRAKLRSK